jgi:haloacetate dehalogenase
MFYGFEKRSVSGDGVSVFVRRKGTGPPVLLLHGFPQTHVMWHRVAPVLATSCTVVCADLRGYGASDKPHGSADHYSYSKRAMANDAVRAMSSLGFDRFVVVGHDRGARVAYRLALDHPDCVSALAVLDIVPTGVAFEAADARMMLGYWPWSLLSQPAPLPERLLAADPETLVDHALAHWGSPARTFPPALREEYIRALRDPATAHAICEEFRAAATLDVTHDAESRAAGERIRCPTLVLWGRDGPLDRWYAARGGPLGIWREWADEVSGAALDGGHFFPESNPKETLAALQALIPKLVPE